MKLLVPSPRPADDSAGDSQLVNQAIRHREIPLIKDTDCQKFRCLWAKGIPITVSLAKIRGSWDPTYITSRYGSQLATMLVHRRDDKIKSSRVKLETFFEEFNKASREDVVKIKVTELEIIKRVNSLLILVFVFRIGPRTPIFAPNVRMNTIGFKR